MNKTLCIYHGNCADGFAAAWVVRRSLGEDNVEFYPGVYQNTPPDVTDRDVVIADFSYKRPVVEDILDRCRSLVILDHHKSAVEELAGMLVTHNKFDGVLDPTRSGARITWDWFFPLATPPLLIQHIEDRDLWRFALPRTREIQAAVFSYPYDFAVWDTLMTTPVNELAKEGEAIERKHHKDVQELIRVVTRPMRIGGHVVPIANLPYTMSSDAGHALARGPNLFAGCYWDTPDGRVFSLRSTDLGMDVSEIAKQYGGGGHRNAAGFRVSFREAETFETWNRE